MKGKNIFTESEAIILEQLVARRCAAERNEQKRIRKEMRDLGFYGGDDFGVVDMTVEKFRALIDKGIITIIQDDVQKSGNLYRKDEKTVKEKPDFKEGLAPWVGSEPKVLILGTMPGDKSLASQTYYADTSHNSFWKIMRCLFPNEEHGDNKQFVTSLGIALWDCVKCGVRKNSTDDGFDSQTLVPNELEAFLDETPSIRTIILNGKGTYNEYFRRFFGTIRCDVRVLPSTSNTNSVPFETKLREWSILKELVK